MILIPTCLFDFYSVSVWLVFSHFDDMVIRSRVLPGRIYFTYSVVLLAGLLLGKLVACRLSALFKGHISFPFAFLILFSPRRLPLGL